jgi:hypothetical protein
VAGSTCSVINDIGAPRPFTAGFDSSTAHLVDGPVPQINRATGLIRVSGHVRAWRGATKLKNIVDGTSLTLLAGEVGRAVSEGGHAYNGDFSPYEWVGRQAPFCQRCGHPVRPPGSTEPAANFADFGFGGNHPSVVVFVMCDTSVKAISRETDLNVLDRMATRANEDYYDLNGTAPNCL